MSLDEDAISLAPCYHLITTSSPPHHRLITTALQPHDWQVRLSTMMPLPSDEEVEGAHEAYGFDCKCVDGGDLLLRLADDPAKLFPWMASHRRFWHDPLSQPIERSVFHLVRLILRKFKGNKVGAIDLTVTEKEALAFSSTGRSKAGA